MSGTVDITIFSNEDLVKDYVVLEPKAGVTSPQPTVEQCDPVDITGWLITMGLTNERGDLVLAFRSDDEEPQIEILDGPAGRFGLRIDYLAFAPFKGKSYKYDIKFKNAAGYDKRLWGGTFTIEIGSAP